MRVLLFLLVVAVALVAGIGYQRGWFEVSSVNDDGHSRISVDVNKDQWRKDRDAVYQQARDRLKDMEHRLDELRARAKQGDSGARHQLNEAVEDLNRKFQAARQELNELEHSGAEHWEAAKTRVNRSLDDLKNGFDKAGSR